MKKGLLIFTIVLLLAAGAIDFLLLKPRSIPASSAHTITVAGRIITVSGNTEEVNVATASKGYYRYRSGVTLVEGKYISGDYFQNTSTVPTGRWIIENHQEQISFTITSSAPVSLLFNSTPDRYIEIIAFTLLIVVALWFFVFVWYL